MAIEFILGYNLHAHLSTGGRLYVIMFIKKVLKYVHFSLQLLVLEKNLRVIEIRTFGVKKPSVHASWAHL